MDHMQRTWQTVQPGTGQQRINDLVSIKWIERQQIENRQANIYTRKYYNQLSYAYRIGVI